jgi:hypothetical protein
MHKHPCNQKKVKRKRGEITEKKNVLSFAIFVCKLYMILTLSGLS